MINNKSPISSISGIGPSKAKLFERIGIRTVDDLINYFPFRYEDTSNILKIADLTESEDKKTVQGEIVSISNFTTKKGKRLTTGKIADETGVIDIIWFNQSFLTHILKPGIKVLLHGKIQKSKKLQIVSPSYEVISEYYETAHLGRITPVYPETKGLTSKSIRRALKNIQNSEGYENLIKENLPVDILLQEKLIAKTNAVNILHFPENMEDLEKAKNRMAFEEIYEILKKVDREKKKQKKYKAPIIKTEEKLIAKFLKELPFKITKGQERSINEVLEDLNSDKPMHRLLEGDVGSGKTLVAIVATINTISNGFQVAILAPTQALAEQHYRTFLRFVPWLEKDMLLITGNTTKRKNKEEKMKESETSSLIQTTNYKPKPILIGTHAILHQADNLLENLGLVIIDEQHRFGVKQREFLTEFIKEWYKPHPTSGDAQKEQGEYSINEKKCYSKQVSITTKTHPLNPNLPHVLSMTATPIPRSLALTLYGDIDISIINEMPVGRIPVETHVVPESKRVDSYDWVRKQVLIGGQVFVICPLVEESEILDAKSATEEFKRLSENVFPDLKVELLHGRIKGDEKDRILTDFRNKKFDILVSTAVVEVGIDIPDATVIIIEGAERFGLAQLHQFRGRVGRSNKKSYCLLFTSSKSKDAIDRLQFFARTNNGLEIAEYDLKRRGPGEVYGTKQSGIPDLKFANLLDLELIKRVKRWF